MAKPLVDMEFCAFCGYVKSQCECEKPQTNADRIRNMTDAELEEFLVEHHRHPCKFCLSCWTEEDNVGGCREELMRWLKSEVKE